MRHCDDETLAVRALGETVGDAWDDGHLSGCARCQSELDELRAVVATCRAIAPDDGLVPAPPAVWDRVRAEVTAQPTSARVIALAPRRWGGRAQVLLAAAACLVLLTVGVLAGALAAHRIDSRPDPVLARAPLTAVAPLTAQTVSGSAVVSRHDGRLVLTVAVRGLTATQGSYYEVWIMDRGLTVPVAVGVLGGSQGSFDLPPSAALDRFPVVDVSLEPLDSDPGHSSKSLVRGTLPV